MISRKSEIKFLVLIIVVFIAACIETDIYLPAFPDMMAWFSASESEIQSLLTWNFVGICVSGPLYGPLSDAFGRKKPLTIALSIFLLGSLITLFSQSLDQMLWGRILQGLGSGGCFTLGTAIIFDTFEKKRAIEATNRLNTIIPLIMAGAPMLGGYLNNHFGFRSNFLAIIFFVALSLGLTQFFFKESLTPEKRQPFKLASILKDFKQALTHVGFWQLTIMMSLSFAGYIAFLSGTSVLFVNELGMSKALFPFVQAAILGGWVAGSLLLDRMIEKWGIPKVKQSGIVLCSLGVAIVGGGALLAPLDPYSQTLGMTIYALGANWVIGLYFPEAMELLPHIKGIAASLLTSTRLLIASVVIGLASQLYNGTIYPLAGTVIVSFAVIIPILFYYERRKQKQSVNSL
jgi:DHA1 family bicyclomycin/chloramphenicol resistance-like MFS transporter